MSWWCNLGNGDMENHPKERNYTQNPQDPHESAKYAPWRTFRHCHAYLNHLYKPVPHQQLNNFIHSPFTLLSTASRQFCFLSISLAAARTASTPKLQVAMQAIDRLIHVVATVGRAPATIFNFWGPVLTWVSQDMNIHITHAQYACYWTLHSQTKYARYTLGGIVCMVFRSCLWSGVMVRT